MLATTRIASWAGYTSAATVTGIPTMACSSLGFIGMVLAHPQRPAAYSALRWLIHIRRPLPISERDHSS